ncbi:sorting nexin-21 isoform X5 [Lagopus muta]|uniref:sorting nexin-21 isoform X5 n=1 Tax=Lagopus muta TaxID=64668 RepID=UPI0020A06B54|nr:sorting nexin-21 isoform X5 [Lagopus muta]
MGQHSTARSKDRVMAAAGSFLDINRHSQESSKDRVGMALNKGGECPAPAMAAAQEQEPVARLRRAGVMGEGAGYWDVVVLGCRGVGVLRCWGTEVSGCRGSAGWWQSGSCAQEQGRGCAGSEIAGPRRAEPRYAVPGRDSPAAIRVPSGGGAAQGGSRDEQRRSGHRSAPPGAARPGTARRTAGMAARILHRLRHALGAEGAREERTHDGVEAEDCPESSELEDDTEGLSTRLSGTLSFSGHEEDEEEEEEEEDGGGGGGEELQAGDAAQDGEWGPAARPGSLLTRQLQELWRRSRSSFVPQRLLFEVTSASVVSERSSKYVEETAAQLYGRDHRQAEPSLRAVPVPPALHR